MKDFYSPGEIKYTRQQCLWILQHLGSLKGGYWPPEATSYTSSKRTGSLKAPFITAAEVYIEITDRLEKCEIDGLILLAMECWGESEESLSKYLNMPIWSIRKRRKNALNYISSSPARRWHDIKGKIFYSEWKDGKRWSSKTKMYYWIKGGR